MKNAIVTGGTSGIGLGVVKMLLKKGYRVMSTYVGPDFTENMENFTPVKVDQTSREQVYGFIEQVKKEFKTVDCIVCNAGLTIRKSFTETTDDDWDKMMEVAVNSHYIIIRELFPLIPVPLWQRAHQGTSDSPAGLRLASSASISGRSSTGISR